MLVYYAYFFELQQRFRSRRFLGLRAVPLKHQQLFNLFTPNEDGGLLRWSSI